MSNYWNECIQSSLEEHGVKATDEQINMIAKDVQIGHENFGMFHGYECIPNPTETEKDRKIKLLQDEISHLKKVEDMFYKNVATRRGVNVSDVHIDTVHERVTYGKML